MDTLTITRYDIPVKGVKKKTVCHFSDVHLTAYDDLSTPEERARALQDTEGWIETRRFFAEKYGCPTGEAQMADSRLQFSRLLALANTADAAVITGDVMNHVTPADIRATEAGFASLQVPFIAVCGNHESAEKLPDGLLLSVMKQPVSVVDLGDIQLVGVDNSNRIITPDQLARVEALLAMGKPTVIALHVPMLTPDNYAAVYGCGEYFRMNDFDGCPSENDRFRALVSAAPVVAVLSGHLHFPCVTEIANGVVQYGVSQGITGNVHLYTIGE
ncbi:MAG: metallophosphoesterase [Clostridia bacterium]|nr:metallophosphoesterase [Clostridia bacterium]